MAKSKANRLKLKSRKSHSVLHKQSFKSTPQKPTSQRPKSIPKGPQKYKNSPLGSGTKPKDNADPSKTPQTTIPFTPYDRILLIGEGDLSFAASLVTHHGCADIWATSYDSEADCMSKYPDTAEANLRTITEAFDGDDTARRRRVLFDVDATKLSKIKDIKALAPFHRIIFNFPHTGGLSTDVNRQVRANQTVLSQFLHSCIPLLSSPRPQHARQANHHDTHNDDDDHDTHKPGSVIVTLFDGEPYTLWNVRDLARSAGYTVWRSWAFCPTAYPGYRHARTAGTILRVDGKASDTAWKGETRSARCYEFGLVPWENDGLQRKKSGKKDEESGSE